MISYKKLFLLMEEQEITKEKIKNKTGVLPVETIGIH